MVGAPGTVRGIATTALEATLVPCAFTDATVNDYYFAYVILVIIINLVEFITTIRSVISLGKGRHFEWWIFAGLSDILCKERESHDDWLYKN